mgnify:CR=1 FL=1
MSTLKADTIQSTGGGAVTLTKQSAAKAWATADDNTTLMDSFNISGITDVSTGVSILAFSNNMTNNLYALTAIGGFGAGTNDLSCISWDAETDLATSSSKTYFISSLNGGGTPANQDLARGCYHWNGDLA